MRILKGGKIKYSKRQILKAKQNLAKVMPFDKWLKIKDWTKDEISTYWKLVEELKKIIASE
jgi:hypothetical protein